jgi:group I intron endonuclease
MKICGIYKITNPIGCVYIGQSINITRRWNEYSKLNGCAKNSRLINSLKKYGFESHRFEILHQCKQEELNDLEIYYINHYDSFNTDHGLNLHSGGNHHIASDETIEKLKKSHIGQKPWNKGLTKDNDERLKEQGKKHSIKMKGRTVSEDTRIKMSNARRGKKHSEETKKILSEKKLGNKIWLGRKHSEESKLKMRKPKSKNKKQC